MLIGKRQRLISTPILEGTNAFIINLSSIAKIEAINVGWILVETNDGTR